jgi:transcriptional repressor NrdR
VYQAFESLEDFESAIALLRHEAEEGANGAAGPKSSEKSPL